MNNAATNFSLLSVCYHDVCQDVQPMEMISVKR